MLRARRDISALAPGSRNPGTAVRPGATAWAWPVSVAVPATGAAPAVAVAPDGADRFATQLAPQPRHVDLDDVAGRALVERVDRVLELLAGEHVAGMLEEGQQQRVFLGARLDDGPVERHRARGGINAQTPDLDRRRALSDAPPRERAQACREFGQVERLDQVVVRAGIEAADPVGEAVARRQYQHRWRRGQLAQRRQQREPVAVGQPQVEDHARIVPRQEGARRAEAFRPVDCVRFLDQEVPHGEAERPIVFDQQYPHRVSVRASIASRNGVPAGTAPASMLVRSHHPAGHARAPQQRKVFLGLFARHLIGNDVRQPVEQLPHIVRFATKQCGQQLPRLALGTIVQQCALENDAIPVLGHPVHLLCGDRRKLRTTRGPKPTNGRGWSRLDVRQARARPLAANQGASRSRSQEPSGCSV